MEEKIGIENLKKTLIAAAKIGKKVMDVMEDGKITKGEYITLAFQLPNGIKVVSGIKPSIPEIKDLDGEEAKEILLAIAEELGIEEDD